MRRIGKVVATGFIAVCLALVLAAAVFNWVVVAPAASKVHTVLANAAASERDLPAPVKDVLSRYLGSRLKFVVARHALLISPGQVEKMRQGRRQLMEVGISFLLPLHLSNDELLSFYAAQVYMGPEIRGFAQAADSYIGVPLANVDRAQAAKLVAISHYPYYLNSPERLERKIQQLLSESNR